MTQEQKRIKLAKAAGWTKVHQSWTGQKMACIPNDSQILPLPDYFNDLNAVHDFISQKLTTTLMLAEYEYRLRACLADGRPTFEVAGYELANAIAAQRCEALGLTLKLWEASK